MIEIKVTGNTPLEALSSVTAFGMCCMSNNDVREAAGQILAAASSQTFGNLPADAPAVCQTIGKVDPAPNTPPTVPVNLAPASTSAPAPVTPAPVTAAPPVAPVAPAPSFTVEQVGKAGADLIAANPAKMNELLALLRQFGVPAITELKPDQLGPFATALRALGGNL